MTKPDAELPDDEIEERVESIIFALKTGDEDLARTLAEDLDIDLEPLYRKYGVR